MDMVEAMGRWSSVGKMAEASSATTNPRDSAARVLMRENVNHIRCQ
ncbi:MAG: hypothetical protein ACJ788_06720 [Ktedonobacteraceae bacterium]